MKKSIIILTTLIIFSNYLNSQTVAVEPPLSSGIYQVSTLAHLRWISENPSSWSSNFVQTTDIEASETSTWNSGAGFIAIGDNNTPFSGTYKGKAHTIDGLYINRPTTYNIGFFGTTNSATVITSYSIHYTKLYDRHQQ